MKKLLLVCILCCLKIIDGQTPHIEDVIFRARFIELQDSLRDRMCQAALSGKIKAYVDRSYKRIIKPKDIYPLLDQEILKSGSSVYKRDDYGKLLPYTFTYQAHKQAFGIGLQVETNSDFKACKVSHIVKGISFTMAHLTEGQKSLKTSFFLYFRLEDIHQLVSSDEWDILILLFDTNIHNLRELESKEDYKISVRVKELCISSWEMRLESYDLSYVGAAFIRRIKQTVYDRCVDFSIYDVYRDSFKNATYVGEELAKAFIKEDVVALYNFGEYLGLDSVVSIQETLINTNVRYLTKKNLLFFEGFGYKRSLYVDFDQVLIFLSPTEKTIWKWYLDLN